MQGPVSKVTEAPVGSLGAKAPCRQASESWMQTLLHLSHGATYSGSEPPSALFLLLISLVPGTGRALLDVGARPSDMSVTTRSCSQRRAALLASRWLSELVRAETS